MHSIGNIACCAFIAGLLTAGAVRAAAASPAEIISISGTGELETAEMMRARMLSANSNATQFHLWISHLLATLNFEARPAEYARLRGSFEFREYTYFISTTYNQGDFLYQEFYVREAQGILSLVRNGPVSIELAAGLMPYKYNPEVRDLGEFLFRSGTYPFYLLNEFDRPFARLTGLRLGVKGGNESFGWKVDGLALTEREVRPFWDFSFAAVAGINLFKILDLGAGVDFAHCIAVDGRLTTPDTNLTQYVKDSVYDAGLGTWKYDYGHYTFKGTKLMARATIDPLGRVRGNRESFLGQLFGENGGKIYGEWGIVGLENYPANWSNFPVSNPFGYDKLKQKMPWMAGFTVPLWKLLDVCAFELEHYPSPNPNTISPVIVDGFPLPPYYGGLNRLNSTTKYDTGMAYVPRWYWSLYMKKEIIRNFSVVCQVGRNHVRWEMPMNYQTADYDYEEAMVRPNEWGWRLKFLFNF